MWEGRRLTPHKPPALTAHFSYLCQGSHVQPKSGLPLHDHEKYFHIQPRDRWYFMTAKFLRSEFSECVSKVYRNPAVQPHMLSAITEHYMEVGFGQQSFPTCGPTHLGSLGSGHQQSQGLKKACSSQLLLTGPTSDGRGQWTPLEFCFKARNPTYKGSTLMTRYIFLN